MRMIFRAVYLTYAAGCRAMLMAGCLMFAAGTAALALPYPIPVAVFVGLVLLCRRRRPTTGNYGTARFAEWADLAYHDLLGGNTGLVIGRADPGTGPTRTTKQEALFHASWSRSDAAVSRFLAGFGHNKNGELIRLKSYTHACAVSPAGRGKGVSYAVVNLLAEPVSMVVNDPKPELFEITAEHRARRFGHRIVRLHPFGAGGDTLNPLWLIDPADRLAFDQCKAFANALVVRTGDEKDPHWNDCAEMFIAAVIAFAVAHGNPEEKNLQKVRDILTNPVALRRAIAAMQQSDAMGGMLRRQGFALTHYVGEELGSVLTCAGRHTAFLDSLPVADSMLENSFDPFDLRHGRMTIYLTIPEEHLHTQAGLMRLWLVSLIRVLTRDGPSEKNPVLFLLDEAGHLGKCQAIENAITLMRGFGVRLFFFYQSLAQIKECYREPGKFLDNMDTQIYWGLNDYASAEAVSKRLGMETIVNTTTTRGDSTSRPTGTAVGSPKQPGSYSTNRSTTGAESGRELMKPDEVLRMPADRVIAFHRNLPPIYARRVIYHQDVEFRRGRLARFGPSSRRIGVGDGVASALFLAAGVAYAATVAGFVFGW